MTLLDALLTGKVPSSLAVMRRTAAELRALGWPERRVCRYCRKRHDWLAAGDRGPR